MGARPVVRRGTGASGTLLGMVGVQVGSRRRWLPSAPVATVPLLLRLGLVIGALCLATGRADAHEEGQAAVPAPARVAEAAAIAPADAATTELPPSALPGGAAAGLLGLVLVGWRRRRLHPPSPSEPRGLLQQGVLIAALRRWADEPGRARA